MSSATDKFQVHCGGGANAGSQTMMSLLAVTPHHGVRAQGLYDLMIGLGGGLPGPSSNTSRVCAIEGLSGTLAVCAEIRTNVRLSRNDEKSV